jgi:hypothetical protein
MTITHHISIIISYIRQGRASRARTRASGARWTLSGWTHESRDTLRARRARRSALRRASQIKKIGPNTWQSGGPDGPIMTITTR